MKLRTLVVTIAVLAVISAVVFFSTNRPAATPVDSRVGQPPVDRAIAEKAARLRIGDQGKTVVLARQGDGTWHVTSYYDFPADFQKLTRFVGDMGEAKLDRLVTRSPERIQRLEFKDTKIEFLDQNDKPLWSVTLGKSSETGGRFVRFGEEPKAYLTTLNAWIDADSKNWADSQLLAIKPDDVAKIELTIPAAPNQAAAETVTVSRKKKGDPWTADKTPANDTLKMDRIASLLSSLTSLRFTETTEPNDPKIAEAKEHLRTCSLTTFDGKVYAIALGRKPDVKKLKPPAVAASGKTGPAALGAVTQLDEKTSDKPAAVEPAKSLGPEFETIPAGPVFAFVTSSDASAPVNTMEKKRGLEVGDYVMSSLPQTASELFQPKPVPATAASAAPKAPGTPKK